jgi:hypothetical protein
VWKLKRLDEFSSPFINEVWKFFDELRMPPEPMPEFLKKLPAPKSDIAKDVNAHVQKMLAYVGVKLTSEALTAKRKLELEGLEELHRKYPHAGFDKAKIIREAEMESGKTAKVTIDNL